MKFIIEKDVPLPSACSELKLEIMEAMKEIKPLESFFIIYSELRPKQKIRTTFENCKKKFPTRFYRGFNGKNKAGTPGIRIFRLADPAPAPVKPKTNA